MRDIWLRTIELVKLLWINFIVQIKDIIEFFQVAYRYYGLPSFMKIDLYQKYQYLFHSPFQISKEFLMKKGEKESDLYGETPLTTLELIARECSISSKDRVFELGSGRGRGCFWLGSSLGCSVVGIEQIPEFVEKCNHLKEKFKLKNVEFRCQDICKADYFGASIIYLYGTCLEVETIHQLIKKFEKLPLGTKIITTSYPLTDYTEKPQFEVMKCFPARFPWGVSDVYLQYIK